jgi:hypothetical protein
MATKANLISAINGFLTSIVTILKHRNSMLEVVNELYNSKVTDNEATTNILTVESIVGLTYVLNFHKVGNSVNVYGRITNETGGILSNVDLAEITTSEYFTDATALNPVVFSSSDSIFQIGATQKIKLNTTLNDGDIAYVNFSYVTNE